MILCILSIIGYYFIFKGIKYSYLIFILQNVIAFYFTNQYYMLVNIIFCIFFYYKLNKMSNIKRLIQIQQQVEDIKAQLKEAKEEEREAIIKLLKKVETKIDDLKHTYNI